MDNFGVASDPGWVNRQLRDMQRQIDGLRSRRPEFHLPTTSATANVSINAVTGQLARSTSSRRYKQDIQDLDLDLAAILKMRPRTWRDKRDVEENGSTAPRYVGFVAEELHDAGLGMFVGYDTEGQPESVNYDRLTVALLIGSKVLVARFGNLTNRMTAAEKTLAPLEQKTTATDQKVTALEASVADLSARLEMLEAAAVGPPPAEPTI